MRNLRHIIEGCQRQDRASQKELYQRFADQLMAVSLRYARDSHQAKDILQNAFLKIFAHVKKFRFGEGSFEGWMSRIVVNEALSQYRRNSFLHLSGTEVYSPDAYEDAAVVSQLAAEDLLALLAQLPDGYRIVFNLKVLEGYSHKEIAQQLGIAESASRSQLARAKRMLRALIHQQNFFENVRA